MRTILVVDDEKEILHYVEAALTRHGYAVLQAQNADEALLLFEQAPMRVDLLLTDVVMPGTSGPMLADRLLGVHPTLPVLFMSGYDDRQVVQRYVLNEGFALLTKPFPIDTLLGKVRELLPAPVETRSQPA